MDKPAKIGDAGDTLVAELGVKRLQLHWLLQITKAICYGFNKTELLNVYEHVLQSQLKVEKLVLFIQDSGWRCELMYGTGTSFSEIDVDRILTELGKLHNLESEKDLWVGAFEAILPIHHKDQLLAYALIGGLANSAIPKKNELVSFVHTITNVIVVAIENFSVSVEKERQELLQHEMEIAAQMQSMLLPSSLPDNPSVRVEALYQPHFEVGGDYYDFIKLNEDEFAFCMADVSGKGVPAALLCSNFQANLNALVHVQPSLTELVRILNRKIFSNANGEKFITFFIGRYNTRTRELTYVNAGHNPPFLIHEKVVFMLDEGSTALGMFEELPFVNVGKTFVPGNAFLHCYTDGVTDVLDEKGEEFGVFRLREFFSDNVNNCDLRALHKKLVDILVSHRGTKGSFTDDRTLLSLWFKH
ncbi:MAG: PP2C family protein-serine/threonine phosphatase [Bacteroidota bacterium]